MFFVEKMSKCLLERGRLMQSIKSSIATLRTKISPSSFFLSIWTLVAPLSDPCRTLVGSMLDPFWTLVGPLLHPWWIRRGIFHRSMHGLSWIMINFNVVTLFLVEAAVIVVLALVACAVLPQEITFTPNFNKTWGWAHKILNYLLCVTSIESFQQRQKSK